MLKLRINSSSQALEITRELIEESNDTNKSDNQYSVTSSTCKNMCGTQNPHMTPKIPTYWCMLCIILSPRVWVELVDKTGELLL